MLYGSEPTVTLSDRGRSPPESFPLVYALCAAPHLQGSKGREFMRKRLGREHEKSNQDIPGLRGFPVWRYVLDNGQVCPAPAGANTANLPMVYVLGPTARKFMAIHARGGTTGNQACPILEHLARALDVPEPPKPQARARAFDSGQPRIFAKPR